MSSLPTWVFYQGDELPREGDLFVVEKVEPDMWHGDEPVTLVTLRRMHVRAHTFPVTKLKARDTE